MRNLIFSLSMIWVLFGNQIKAQDMRIMRIYEEGLSQSGYILIDNKSKEAIVIDPRKDVQEFIDTLNAYDATLKFVTETHIHADYLSGSRELAKMTASTLRSEERRVGKERKAIGTKYAWRQNRHA